MTRNEIGDIDMSRLAALQGAFAKNTGSTGENNFQNNYYRFWDMDFDDRATVRFLPDTNEENPYMFFVEKVTHNLEINGERKTVPCLSMYGKDCPICAKSRAFYKEEGDDSVSGKALYKRRQHLAQALVVEDPIPVKAGEESALGQLRLLAINFTLYSKIKEAIEDGELDEVPCDFEEGTDFIIKKTKKGKWANYESSKFERRARALTDDDMAIVEDKSIDLATLLPKEPTLESVSAQLNAWLNGQGLDEDEEQSSAPAKSAPAKSAPAKAADPVDDNDADGDNETDSDVDDILASIKARRNK